MPKHAAARSTWRPVALAAVAGLALLGTGAGVLATLVASASGSQSVSTGSLTMSLAGNGTFGTAISGLAPGDTVQRYVTLTNSGSLAGQALSLTATGSGSPELTTSSATALKITVSECTSAWTPSSGACSGTITTPVSSQSLPVTSAALNAAALPPTNGTRYLRLSLTVPDNGEVSTDGTPPATTVQGKSATVAFTFTETQRSSTVTNS